MVDPLEAVRDPVRREQLRAIRAMDGETRPSGELRGLLPGFRGQKGIYKPTGSRYALWIRQTLRGVYADKELIPEPDGSWSYDYAPEGRGGVPDMSLDTNRALLECMEDGVPVGVIRQVRSRPGERLYEVQGLGYVTGFDGNHFKIRGEPIDVSARPAANEPAFEFEPFDRVFPSLAPAIRRMRDDRFKLAVRRVYHERCGLCGIGYHLKRIPLALQAAHVIPVQNDGTSKDIRNGILLCNNHHALFDSYTWTIDEDLRVMVTSDPDFRRSALLNHVLKIEGSRLANLPDESLDYPAPKAIKYRLGLFEEHQ